MGIHFWPDFALVNGIRVDYFSPTLFFTDTLVIGIFLLELFKLRFPKMSRLRWGVLGVVGVLGVTNIYFSLSPAVSIYKWIKILEFGLLGYVLVKKFEFNQLTKWLLIPVFYESVLAIWQFWAQSSIGGIWYFLGERTFYSSTPGIANAYFNGQLLMRPYGTFSHPNVLGGFLTVFLPLILVQFLHNSRRINALRNWRSLGVLGLGYAALLLSLSRSAIIVGLVASLFVAVPYLKRNKIIGVIGGIGVIGAAILFWPRISSMKVETEPIIVREQLNNLAIAQWSHSPILGTGLGTSPLYSQRRGIKNFALQFQPTHNIYLLTLAETGIVGLVLLTGTLLLAAKKLIKEKKYLLLSSLLSIAVLGLFDHYLLTLQQGQLILTFVLALTYQDGI